jgi:hypothetical protein
MTWYELDMKKAGRLKRRTAEKSSLGFDAGFPPAALRFYSF